MRDKCICDQQCPYGTLIKKGEGAVPCDDLCQNPGTLCPPCALLDMRLDMAVNIREPRNLVFLVRMALPIARIMSEVEQEKERLHELFSEFLDVSGRRFYEILNLGKVQAWAKGLTEVLPKKVTGFWEAFGTLGGKTGQVKGRIGQPLLFVLWKSGIEDWFKEKDHQGNWQEWKECMQLTGVKDVEKALKDAGVKENYLKLWKIEGLI